MSQNENFERETKDEKASSLPISCSATTNPPNTTMDNKVLQMMKKMGYKVGSGLGKNEQGIVKSIEINSNLGKRGFGLYLNNLNFSNDLWDFSQDDIVVKEKIQWLENDTTFSLEPIFEIWIKEGPPDNDILKNCNFCDRNILEDVFKAKNIFDELDHEELYQARSKANPFESVRSVFFMNRAALKMANIDTATDFLFTSMEQNEYFKSEKGPIYFTDVCAGPGGFTEYILWRKQWYKGFGLTLRNENDFKVMESTCASDATFQTLYGAKEDGDVCNPENICDFTEKVIHETDMQGVHFMMSDGGFCVDGNENLQEILSKNIYVSQCMLALKILKPHGSFVTKLFDIFTPFSIGLLYLMHLCFKKVGILKPKTSRPANSERYFVCNNFIANSNTNSIRAYLWKVVLRLWELKNKPDRDVLEIVPLNILKQNEHFLNYILESNNMIGTKQIIALKKLAKFCRNPNLIDSRQNDLRQQCLEYWKLPDKKRKMPNMLKPENIMSQVTFNPELMTYPPKYIKYQNKLLSTISDLNAWHYCYMVSSQHFHRSNFYVATGDSKVYRQQKCKWVKISNLKLIPGTILYGELVKETLMLENNEFRFRYSLHVIDAACLGSKEIQTFGFQERLELIKIYCKAVNKESQSIYSVRVRPKVLKQLSELPQDILIKNRESSFFVNLPIIGYKSLEETYEVNSLLLLKTDNNQSFQSTFISRIHFFNATEKENDSQSVSFDELRRYVQNMFIL